MVSDACSCSCLGGRFAGVELAGPELDSAELDPDRPCFSLLRELLPPDISWEWVTLVMLPGQFAQLLLGAL